MARVLVTIASNTSASMLASDMASYGQALSSSSLDGKRKICAWTGVLVAIIMVIIIVVVIILAIFSSGTGAAAFFAGGGWILVAGLVLAVAAVAIQMTVIQPGITAAWNEIISATLSMQNQFTEGAIQSALNKSVTDAVEVPDVIDQDRDRLWVPAADIGSPPFDDVVSRYGMYYTERLRQIKDQVAYTDIEAFITALTELLYEGSDGWGLHDPIPSAVCLGLAECHPCCMPNTAVIDGDPLVDIRPSSCFNSTDDDYWAQQCEPASPYQVGPPGDGTPGTGYPFLFDGYTENPYNPFLSFREQVGLDDEHRDFYKDSTDPNSIPSFSIPGARASQFAHIAGNENFRLEDATGFYSAPQNPINTDPLVGIYPFFYKMADWGVDLANVHANIVADPLTTRECHWCDDRNLVDCVTCPGYAPHPHPGEIPQLVLPLDPTLPADGLLYNRSFFVDGIGNWVDVSNAALFLFLFPPLAVDKVTIPIPGDILADDDPATAICAQHSLYPPPPSADGFWRKGGDRFCRTTAPYFMECLKCGGTPDCECTSLATDPADFPDDVIDDLIYSLPDFFAWAQRVIAASSDMASFTEDFPNWYPEAAVWIEPESAISDATTDPPCFPDPSTGVCLLIFPDDTVIPEGILRIWLKELIVMRDRILGWINNYDNLTGLNEGYPGNTCTEVWCVPDSTLVCPEIPAGEGEDATFDANANGVQGDVEDIVSCLSYNINGYDHVAGEAFQACLNNCGIADCTVGAGGTLPAFHLDGITPYNYPATILDCISAPGWTVGNDWFEAITANVAAAVKLPTVLEGNDTRFRNCALSCSLKDCHRLPRSMLPFAGGAVYWPADYQPWDSTLPGLMAPAIADGDWEDLTAFNDCLGNCNPENCLVGPRLPTVHTSDGVTPWVYPAGAADCATWFPGDPWFDGLIAMRDSIRPMDEADLAPMLRCFDDCNANIADCQAMPQNQTSTLLPGPPVPYTWTAGPPAGFAPGDCDAVTNQPLAPWDSDITVNVLVAGGPSCDLIAGQWLHSTRQSVIEAVNQVAKFTKRRDFLGWRLTEAENILSIFHYGEDSNRNGLLDPWEDIDGDAVLDTGIIPKLDEFLDIPTVALINARINYAPVSGDSGLPYQAIYGWRDENEVVGAVTVRGKWHIVKVEARVPGMCDNRCSASQSSPDPGWPRIKTYTKNWGTKRCYELVSISGSVKFRTTRWDEDKSGKPCAGLAPCPAACSDCGLASTATYRPVMRFPNGVPIWSFKGSHPLRPLDLTAYNPDQLDLVCAPHTISLLPGTLAATDIYEGAFIMNDRSRTPGPYATYIADPCWDFVHGFLASGVVNETCAQYYWKGGSLPGMGLRFVRCEEF
ncbi:MAG: hypothetical protein KAJ70_02740 [Candidatus Omnitrophica bacterium]|nr:hypothetical protein [Candidatus Omnitrophota bacterium]